MKPKCDICGKPMPGPEREWPDHPFCSPRCRKIDLGRWLGEEYKLPGRPAENVAPEDDAELDT